LVTQILLTRRKSKALALGRYRVELNGIRPPHRHIQTPIFIKTLPFHPPIFPVLILQLLTLGAATLSIDAAPDKLSVITVFTDDQGSFDMNIYGSKDPETPHMDALAHRGVRFTRFYSATAV